MNSVGDDLPSFCVQSPSYSPKYLSYFNLTFFVRAPEAKMYKKAAGKKFQQAISCQWRLAGFFRQKLPFLLQEEVVRRHRLRNTAFGQILGWGEFLLMQPRCRPLVPPYLLLVVVGNMWPNAG